jgi:hypothetical protein
MFGKLNYVDTFCDNTVYKVYFNENTPVAVVMEHSAGTIYYLVRDYNEADVFNAFANNHGYMESVSVIGKTYNSDGKRPDKFIEVVFTGRHDGKACILKLMYLEHKG